MIGQPELIAFQDKWKRDLKLVAQQMNSRLVDLLDLEPDERNARKFYFNHIGQVNPRAKTGFNGDSPVMTPDHSRRMGSVVTYEWGDLYDEDQTRTMVENPQNKHKLAAVAGFYRKMDLTIINAALGNSVVVDSSEVETATALPAAQIIAVGATGLTVAKIRRAKRLFDAAEVDEGVVDPKRVMVVTSSEVETMLATSEITSADFNTVKALAEGRVNTFCGFEFRRVESVPLDGNGDRRVVAIAKGGIGGFMDMEPKFEMGVRTDKSMSIQHYLKQLQGATRVEDVRVIEIKCTVAA